MIKKLFFIATLVVPGLAFGGNPTAGLSVQIVPTGSSSGNCGAAPVGQAAADLPASFTTCARYNDFTTAIPNTVGTGLPNNWLNCNESDETPGYPWYVMKTWEEQWDPHLCASGSGANAGNSVIYQTNDGGTLALAVDDGLNVSCSAGSGPLCDPMMTSIPFSNNAQAPNPGLYGNSYIEFQWRTSSSNFNNYGAFWSDVPPNEIARVGAPAGTYVENDFMECCSNPIDGQHVVWPNGGPSGGPCCGQGLLAGYDVTQYHTWGFLQTGDGNGNYRLRWYLDGQLLFDQGQTYGNSAEANERRQLILWSGGSPNNVPAIFYYRYFKVITCANWQNADSSGMCNG